MARKPLTELALIARTQKLAGRQQSAAVRLGIGDDCAILVPPRGHEILVTTDFSLEGRHFRRDWHTAASAGHRTLARGLSDLAAMGATPVAAFLSMGLPAAFDPVWVDEFLAGLLALAEAHKVPLAGGDTAESPGKHILADIVLVGSAPAGRALRRSGARAGDRLFCSGALGGAAAQLDSMVLRPFPTEGPQAFPEPRLRVGQTLLRGGVATACIDLSDGLSTDLDHLCAASNVHAELHKTWIPVHAGATFDQALHGGEDYELLFAAPSEVKVPRSIGGVPLTQVGRLTEAVAGEARVLLDGLPLDPGGHEHFRL